MKFRKKKKVEEVIKDEEIKEDNESGEVEEEAVIEPTDEVPTPESDFRFGDKVVLITPRDYDNKRIDIDMFAIYTVNNIDGDKVELKKQSGAILPTKISNIRKIK